MVINMKEIMHEECGMDAECLHLLMAMYSLVSGKEIKEMAKVSTPL